MLSNATTQNWAGRNDHEGVLRVPQSSSITGTSPSDCLVSYQDTPWLGVLLFYRDTVGVFYSPSRLGKLFSGVLLLGLGKIMLLLETWNWLWTILISVLGALIKPLSLSFWYYHKVSVYHHKSLIDSEIDNGCPTKPALNTLKNTEVFNFPWLHLKTIYRLSSSYQIFRDDPILLRC